MIIGCCTGTFFLKGNTRTAAPWTTTPSSILQNNLATVSFQGASGWIDFSKSQESPSFVNTLQVQKGSLTLIGVYNPYSHNIYTLTKAAPHVTDVPLDTFVIN